MLQLDWISRRRRCATAGSQNSQTTTITEHRELIGAQFHEFLRMKLGFRDIYIDTRQNERVTFVHMLTKDLPCEPRRLD
jgi:hypothetical protein